MGNSWMGKGGDGLYLSSSNHPLSVWQVLVLEVSSDKELVSVYLLYWFDHSTYKESFTLGGGYSSNGGERWSWFYAVPTPQESVGLTRRIPCHSSVPQGHLFECQQILDVDGKRSELAAKDENLSQHLPRIQSKLQNLSTSVSILLGTLFARIGFLEGSATMVL